ncbi:hypothetical protein HSX11_02510 [Oxalobacteraceae bacterium]|nr:hypothetical protein [Oxalobacteraceae bacterium]
MTQPTQSNVQQNHLLEQTYKVVLKGLRSDVPVDTAKKRLAALFKASQEQVDGLLASGDYAVKKLLPHDVALKYQRAIGNAGGVCELVVDSPFFTLDVELPNPIGMKEKPAAQPLDDTIIFQGDVTLIKSYLKIVEGDAVGTSAKFVFVGDKNGEIVLLPDDVLSVSEEKHLFVGKKWVVRTRTGDAYQFVAANKKALSRAMLALSGKSTAAVGHHADPDILAIKNKTAWLAAIGPTLSGVIVLLLGAALDWNFESLGTLHLVQLWLFKLSIVYVLLRVDYLSIQSQGFNPVKLGIASPQQGPLYLFSRAKALGQSRAYAITWSILFALEVAGPLFL